MEQSYQELGKQVPGALFTMPRAAAARPARPPPKKLEVKIGIGCFVTMCAWVSGSKHNSDNIALVAVVHFVEDHTVCEGNHRKHAIAAIPIGRPVRPSIAVKAIELSGKYKSSSWMPPSRKPYYQWGLFCCCGNGTADHGQNRVNCWINCECSQSCQEEQRSVHRDQVQTGWQIFFQCMGKQDR